MNMIKAALMKRRNKFKPEDESMGLMAEESEEMSDSDEPVVDEEAVENEPKVITLKIEGEEEKEGVEKDIAPGKPAEPEDMAASKEEAHSQLMDAIMGGLSEEDIMMKKGKLSLGDRIKQHAFKMKS